MYRCEAARAAAGHDLADGNTRGKIIVQLIIRRQLHVGHHALFCGPADNREKKKRATHSWIKSYTTTLFR